MVVVVKPLLSHSFEILTLNAIVYTLYKIVCNSFLRLFYEYVTSSSLKL